MAWTRMRFRDQIVFVNTDDAGRPVLDADGRAEMKYREGDDKSYRPSPRNLIPAGGGGGGGSGGGARKGGSKARKRKAPKPRDAGPRPANEIAIWTDGACTGNPGPMGIGMVVIANGKQLERGEFLGTGTNNIAELEAIGRGLDMAEELCPGVTNGEAEAPIRIYSDSGYSIGVLSLGWKAKANRPLIEGLRARLARIPKVTFEKVAGHAGIPLNERCDELARAAITERGTIDGSTG